MHETLADVGELGVIAAIRAQAPSRFNGDDAAVLYPPAPNHRTVAATDMMVAGNHFRLDWSTPEQVGEKIVLRNFADVEAMGGRPVACLLALAAPPDTPVKVVEGLAQGVGRRCTAYNAELVGGDVTHSRQLMVTVTALGLLGGDLPPLTLDAARPGHSVIAHGHIGYAAAGLALLMKFGADAGNRHPEFWPLITAQCAPWLEPGSGVVARAAGATAMTDNSDGLIPDLSTMCARSGVNMDLSSRALAPDDLLVAAGQVLDADPWEWILAGGEDHTLLATTPGEVPSGFRKIGTVSAHGRGVVRVDGRPAAYDKGWKAYAKGAPC